MANIIKIKRGLKANINSLTLQPGELGVALDTQELYVGDQGGVVRLVKGAAAGVVESAEKLDAARNIAITGDATGSASFDGSKDIEIALALANSGVTAGTYSKVTVDAAGRVTAGSSLTKADLPTIVITDIDKLQEALDNKANIGDSYTKEETYNKTEIDEAIAAKDSLPSQANNAGKFLTTDGTTASWGTVDLSSKANVSDLNDLEDELADTKSTLEGQIAAKAAADSVYTKTEIDGKVSTINTNIAKKADATSVYTKDEANTLLADKANSADVYTKTEVNTELAKKADAATTLAGYKITDAYTKTDVDGFLADKADAATMTTELGKKADKTTVETLETNLTNAINEKATKADTLAGYGIGDAYTKTEVDAKIAGTFKFQGEVESFDKLPTSAKEGDVYQVGDKEYAYDGDSWVELGFNIDLTSYATKTEVSNTYATKTALSEGLATKAEASNVYTKTEIDGEIADLETAIGKKANSADVYTKGQVDTALANKADKADTLAEYGITDAYTKTEVDTAVNAKATKATTLAGYGITNAYTKTEVDTIETDIYTAMALKYDASSVIDGGTFGESAE